MKFSIPNHSKIKNFLALLVLIVLFSSMNNIYAQTQNRSFQLYIENPNTGTNSDVSVELTSGPCYEGTMPNTFIKGGTRQLFTIANRIEGYGCDGKYGYFTLSFSSSNRVFSKVDFAVSFRGDLYTVPGKDKPLGTLHPKKGYSYTYTTHKLPKPGNSYGDYSFENGAIYGINAQNEKTKINPGKAIIQFQNGKYSSLMTTREGFINLKDNEKLYLSPGRFELTERLHLKNLNNIQIIGNNTSLVAMDDVSVVYLTQTSNVYIKDVLVVHELNGACSSDGLIVQDSTDIHITNCRFDGSGIRGIKLEKITNATIENNHFFNCSYGFDVESSQNIILKNNSFSENRSLDITGKRTQFVNDFTSENSFMSYKDKDNPYDPETAVLNPGQELWPGEKLVSRNSVYYLEMQKDGNLCLKTIAGDRFLWCMITDSNKLIEGTVCAMQEDGNLNVSPREKWVWSAFNKASQLTSGSYLELTDEGTIKIIAPNGTVKWQNI